MQQASGQLRICWSPDWPPSPPLAVDPRPCYTGLTFSEGVRDLGLLVGTVQIPTPNAGTPRVVTRPVSGPDTGDGASAGGGGAPVAVALALASLAAAALVGGALLRRRR